VQKSTRGFAAALASLLILAGSGIFLPGCGSGGTVSTFIPLPVVSISPTTGSVQAGASLQFTATVVTPTATTITWSVNHILGGNATLGTVSATGLYTAPASVPSPSTVTVEAISSAETNPTGAAIVTITAPAVNATVSVAPLDSSTPVGTKVQFAATVTGVGNTAVIWSVNGVAGGNSTVGTVSAAGLYTAPSAVPSTPTVSVTATSAAQPTSTASTTLTLTASNSAPLFVNFGPNGDTGISSTDNYNGLFTTVTVCLAGTPDCQIIPNILVDTSSVGLRVLNSALVDPPATELQTIKDSTGNQVQECVQLGDTSYLWGPVLLADVVISGETASSVPIQVIGDTTFDVPAASCLTLGAGPSLDTVQALGANGILGVGTGIQDCGLNCAAGQTFSGYPYYVCPAKMNYVCQTAPLPVVEQVANPVAFFPKDNNGVEIVMPSIASTGVPKLPYSNAVGGGLIPAGQLIFGVGTESNNALGSATLYAADAKGNFPKIVFNNTSYLSAGTIDSGSNALYVLNPSALNVQDCADNRYYCSALSFSLTAYGANGTSGTINLSFADADTLFASSPGFAAFNNLGGASGEGLSADEFDLGLPFFYGRSVFVGIAGMTVPNNVSAPNGYFAF
jgi:hypothetical protein